MHTHTLSGLLCLSSLCGALPLDQEVLRPLHSWHSGGKDIYEVRKELQNAEIIPTVMDDFHPIYTLDAEWSSDNAASLGNTLKPDDLDDAPRITLTQPRSHPSSHDSALQSCIRANTTYTLVLTDPDAPSRDDPKWGEFCHWIATGVPLSTSSETGCARLELAGLKDLVEYKPPAPPKKTGKHRYVFLAFAPANGTSEPLHLTTPDERKRWGRKKNKGDDTHGVRDWAEENGLVPVAANSYTPSIRNNERARRPVSD